MNGDAADEEAWIKGSHADSAIRVRRAGQPRRGAARPRRRGDDDRRDPGLDPWRDLSATLGDSNVLLDLATADPAWADWSVAALDQFGGLCRTLGPLCRN